MGPSGIICWNLGDTIKSGRRTPDPGTHRLQWPGPRVLGQVRDLLLNDNADTGSLHSYHLSSLWLTTSGTRHFSPFDQMTNNPLSLFVAAVLWPAWALLPTMMTPEYTDLSSAFVSDSVWGDTRAVRKASSHGPWKPETFVAGGFPDGPGVPPLLLGLGYPLPATNGTFGAVSPIAQLPPEGLDHGKGPVAVILRRKILIYKWQRASP